MSDTIYLHEVTRRPGAVRVSLIMDAAEVRAVADIASAAIDGCVLTPEGEIDNSVLGNANAVYKWAIKAANTLELSNEQPTNDEE